MLSENLNMFKLKSLYIQVSFSFSFLFSNGPFLFDSLTEQDGLRNGPDYSEALLYYPLDAISPLPVVDLVPGFTKSISAQKFQNGDPVISIDNLEFETVYML